jgi:hypothetical protein
MKSVREKMHVLPIADADCWHCCAEWQPGARSAFCGNDFEAKAMVKG